MIVEFSVANFRSIKEMQTLSFVATAINEHEQTHTFEANDKVRLLKSVGIYGANSSGKSNVVKAMWAMLNFIRYSFGDKPKLREQIQPFKLNTETRNEGSFFQIVFLLDKKTYRYGFVYDKGKVTSEWLFGTANTNEVMYFTRNGIDFDINKERFKEGIGLEAKTNDKNLFLNVVHEFNGIITTQIHEQFLYKLLIVRGNDTVMESFLSDLSRNMLENDTTKVYLQQFMSIADAELMDIRKNEEFDPKVFFEKKLGKKFDEEAISGDFNILFKDVDFQNHIESAFVSGNPFEVTNQNQIISQKKLFDKNNNEVGLVEMDFEDEASDGTKKMFRYASTILNYIENGGILVIDEFDARLHTNLTRNIIKLFNSNKNKSAQLCFVTHDTNLLDKELLRRDQIYFTEKNLRGETSLYSLNEIKGVRNDASFEKDYIKGKYGAIPFVSNTNSIFG
jgi:uncharacterized protein